LPGGAVWCGEHIERRCNLRRAPLLFIFQSRHRGLTISPRPRMKYKIGYCNVMGLMPPKFKACCELIDGGVFDILFLAETWFCGRSSYLSHPYAFAETHPKSKSNATSTRASGGVALLLSTSVRAHVRSHKLLPDGIFVDIDGMKILGCYIPPSIASGELASLLSSFPDHDVFLGDITSGSPS
jgi:hypothetical protein